MLLALPCGRDHDHIIEQTRAMTTGFIQYLQQKQAAGIVNVAEPETQQVRGQAGSQWTNHKRVVIIADPSQC